jgi:hypothetical protein
MPRGTSILLKKPNKLLTNSWSNLMKKIRNERWFDIALSVWLFFCAIINYIQEGSLWWTIVLVITAILVGYKGITTPKQKKLAEAKGKNADKLAEAYDCYRLPGETDEALKKRTVDFLRPK